MNRRNFIGMAGGALAGAQAFGLGTAAKTTASAGNASGKPNFLFMIADDLMFRTIGSINNPEVHTPNLDRLAAQGCHFSHCFHQGSWTGAICIASRTMLLTGLTAFKAEKAIPGDQSAQIPVWGQTLRENGYRTFVSGKWHLDAVSLQRSFAEQAHVGPGYLPSTPDMYNRPAPGNHWSSSDESLKGHWLDTKLWDDERQDETRHSSEVYADATIHFLEEHARSGQDPFFVYLGFNAPHDPRQAPQKYLDMYPVDSIKIPPNFLPEHPFDQGQHRTRDELLAPFPRTEFDVRTHRREYYAIITHLDAQVGRILDALERSGQAENTYVIFTADHGLAVGEHGLMGKQNQYECSMRMPLIVKGPRVPAGKHVDEMVYQHCMFATTCEIAGIPVPKHVEFPSLAPMIFKEDAVPLYDAMFGWLNVLQRSVRTRQHKLIYYIHIDRYQLFDIEKDPWEMNDLINDPSYATVKNQMKTRLHELQVELGDPMVQQQSGQQSTSSGM
jgi:arylsulfatase A-like enzyme